MSIKSNENNVTNTISVFRDQSELLSFMSHELRTPLNAILGYAELLTKQVHGPIQPVIYKDYVEAIKMGGDHMLALVNDILDYAKLQSGKMTLYEQQIDLSYLFENCIKLLTSLAQQKEVSLKSELSKNIPLFFADERFIRQILLNLISNGIKYTKAKGYVLLKADLLDNKIVLSVEDNGVGMNEEEILLALQPFAQINTIENHDMKGTGLGLPLVKSLTELHGGVLSITSQKGKGSRFTLTFPTHRAVHP
jgi:signal transduction histidine kinase